MNDIKVEDTKSKGSALAIPAAIIIGFGLIALSIYFGGGQATTPVVTDGNTDDTASLDNIDPITEDDHIRGNPNAPIVIVEYSDFDCPYCQNFHNTMKKIMDEYGPGGQVAWVYRHLPLTSLHPSAAHIAEASECVAELGGDEAFWQFADTVFSERLVDPVSQTSSTDVVKLPEFAESAGIESGAYQECIDSGRNREAVDADFRNAQAIGAQGTPHSIVISGENKMTVAGAESYERMKVLIDGLLK